LTALRSSPISSTRRPTRRWPSAKRQARQRAPPPASHLFGRIRRWILSRRAAETSLRR
jgi:hypothetical protein